MLKTLVILIGAILLVLIVNSMRISIREAFKKDKKNDGKQQ